MKTNVARNLIAAACAFAAAGCITSHQTVVQDTTRAPVSFENDAAARIFYEALSKMKDTSPRGETTTKVEIPIIFSHEYRVVRGPNGKFNEAVTRCDANQDGRITEAEARVFAEEVARNP